MENLVFSALTALGTGVIGYLLNDNRTLRSVSKNLRAIVIGICTKILEDDHARKESKEMARKAISEIEKL